MACVRNGLWVNVRHEFSSTVIRARRLDPRPPSTFYKLYATHTTTTGNAAALESMDDNVGAGHKAASLGKLSAEALEKREARARKRQEQGSAGGQDNSQGPTQDKANNKEEEEDMWTNEYAFSSFSLKVQEEFGGEACVGGTQWPGTSLVCVCLWRASAHQIPSPYRPPPPPSTLLTGGVRVARYLDNPVVFAPGALQGKTLLDLGSGCGLVAAVAAKHGARVLAAEKDIVIPLLKENLSSNGVLIDDDNEDITSSSSSAPTSTALQEGKVAVEELYWGPDAQHPHAPFDIVIAAACLYMPKTVSLLLHTLWNLSNYNTLVILCSILGANTLETFIKEVGGFFEITALDDTDGHVVGTSEEGNLASIDVATRVLVLRRKTRGDGGGVGGL